MYKYPHWDTHTLKWVRDTKNNTVGWFWSVNSIICQVWYGQGPYKNRTIFFSEKTSHNQSGAWSSHPMICWVAYWIITCTRVCIHMYVCVYRRDSFRCHCSFQRNLQILFTIAEAVQLGRGGNGDIRVGRRLLQLPKIKKSYTKPRTDPNHSLTNTQIWEDPQKAKLFQKKKRSLIWMSRGYPHLQKSPTNTHQNRVCAYKSPACMQKKPALAQTRWKLTDT